MDTQGVASLWALWGDDACFEQLQMGALCDEPVLIAAGPYASYAVASDGCLWGYDAQDDGSTGGEEDGPCSDAAGASSNPSTLGVASQPRVRRIERGLENTKVTGIGCGGSHVVIACTDEQLLPVAFAWGCNDDGRLGTGDLLHRRWPTKLSLRGVVAVGAGERHSAAVTADGACLTWGFGASGRLGHGDEGSRSSPVRVGGLEQITKIACGWSHNVALSSDGLAYTWGWGSYGQLGAADCESSFEPTLLESLQVHPCTHSLTCMRTHTIPAWLHSCCVAMAAVTHDRLCHGRPQPRIVGQADVVVDAACGVWHTLLLTSEHSVYGMGTRISVLLIHPNVL